MNYRQTPVDRRIARDTKHTRQAIKREHRREARRGRKGIGAEIAWDASTTVPPQQFPSAYDTSNPIVSGIGRTLSRGL